MLTSSLNALLYTSVPTVIVMRNLSTLTVAILECFILDGKTNAVSIGTLIAMLVSAILYAQHDFTLNATIYAWLSVNIFSTSAYQVYVKKIVHMPSIENIGSLGMAYYNNLFSLLPLLILAVIKGEVAILLKDFNAVYFFQAHIMIPIVASCILGCCLSISAFKLNHLISATSIMVTNNVNKFSVIIISELCIESTLDGIAFVSAVFVLFFGWLYSQTTKPYATNLFIAASIMLGVLGSYSFYKANSSPFLEHTLNTSYRNTIPEDANGIYRSYLPPIIRHKSAYPVTPSIQIKNVTDFQLPSICVNKSAAIWNKCDPRRCEPQFRNIKWKYPTITNMGEKTSDFIDRVLKVAWGSNPPSIDLYLRSGCHGIMEMRYLFESIEIFYPKFLGSVILILDVGDEHIVKNILVPNSTHNYIVGFEHVPCLPGRVLNQYSYLYLDRYSTADYVVTIDSDCVFHSPVTPDLIFRQGRVILASTRTFEWQMWYASLEAMMGPGMYDGHYMVTQPVTFAVSTFPSFRRWFYEDKGRCYEDHLSQLNKNHYHTFCWMCQLGSYLEKTRAGQKEYDLYWYQHMDHPQLEPILRYSAHVRYEAYGKPFCPAFECYEETVNIVFGQGLCRAFGPSIFHICANQSNTDYINNVTFLYVYNEIQAANQTARTNALRAYLARLSAATRFALKLM
ncbi:unnamed protein product [Adineta ricciae]|nr:unnamed protein product [Adineta ricciae]